MFLRKTPLEKAIAAGLRTHRLADAIRDLEDCELKTLRDVKAICRALEALRDWGPDKRQFEAINQLCDLMQRNVASQQAFDGLCDEALPVLLELFDRGCANATDDNEELLNALETFAQYDYREGLRRLIACARRGFHADSWRWGPVFSSLRKDGPRRAQICNRLADPLPPGRIAGALLSFANATMLGEDDQAKPKRHPFDHEQGHARLEAWLTVTDPEHLDDALTAAIALAFLGPAAQQRLFGLAMEHASHLVQLEAAWGSAKAGNTVAVKVLARLCCDVHSSATACRYLEEVGRADAIPAEAKEPNFQAMAIMSQWLQHPHELGHIPEKLELADSREMYWPPTRDRRRLWLFRFIHRFIRHGDTEETVEVAYGLVGGVNTWSFFSVVEQNRPIEDIYALHCSWESQIVPGAGPQSPKYSVEHGRKLLSEHWEK
jgi:hypothetical protein